MTDRLDQLAGDRSTNLQAGRDINYGPTVTEVIEIAELTVEARMDRLRGIAGQEAEKRIRDVLSMVGVSLDREPASVQEKAKDPAFQFALLDVEKAYAASGDVDLATRLTEMLIDRTRREERSLAQVVLGEALIVAPKLTPRLFDAVTALFVLRYVTFTGARDPSIVIGILRQHLAPFLEHWPHSQAEWQHLAYTGCGTLDLITGFDIFDSLRERYKPALDHVDRPSFEATLRLAHPAFTVLLDNWEQNVAKSFTLQSVGLAIAHNNWQRVTGERADLEIWIS